MFSKDAIKLYVMGISLLALTAFVFFRENTTDWRDYQAEFRDLVTENSGRNAQSRCRRGFSRYG